MRRLILLLTTHLLTLGVGFGLGVYFLPILTAPDDPPVQKVQAAMEQARYHATLHRDQKGSDALHWADGTLSISSTAVAFTGKIAPRS
ncbi:hypothetical protein [Stenotrophomonas sp. SRS1]|uniref:hypothetical protein n=1 Tax=Stenotrophomonas sp. SRS1 TaxID=2870345 RepID=UPI0022379FD7|nr:hypothetical protein [Stenotrophomonas sp. SRS1]